jgi:hypothetical protein
VWNIASTATSTQVAARVGGQEVRVHVLENQAIKKVDAVTDGNWRTGESDLTT